MGLSETLVVQAVQTVVVGGQPVAATAREFGMSRVWLSQLVGRARAAPEEPLRRSRRPHTSPQQIDGEVAERVCSVRRRLTERGFDAGPATIHDIVCEEVGWAPAPSTIARILSDAGLVVADPSKRPKSAVTRFEADLPNQRWQADITKWQLSNGVTVEILNVLDDHSRVAVRSDVSYVFDAHDVVDTFTAAFDMWGLPRQVLTDNGSVFTSRPGHAPVALEHALAAAGVHQVRSTPYHPQTCGKVERFHQTMKKWLRKQPQPATITQLQALLDEFIDEYNHRRNHSSCGRKPPITRFTARRKATPAAEPIRLDTRSHHATTDPTGKVQIKIASNRYYVALGRHHRNKPVLVITQAFNVKIIDKATGQILRQTIIRPDQPYQPLTA